MRTQLQAELSDADADVYALRDMHSQVPSPTLNFASINFLEQRSLNTAITPLF